MSRAGSIDSACLPDLHSAIVLRALTNPQTGAIAAAVTTSLPEQVGGERSWDYRSAGSALPR